MTRARILPAVLLAAVATLFVAIPAGAKTLATTATKTTSVTVTAGKPSEFRFTLSKKSVPVGTVVFTVKNVGTTIHDFKINGKATAILSPNKSATLKVVFKKAGSYAYLCTVPGHASLGMKGTFTVTK